MTYIYESPDPKMITSNFKEAFLKPEFIEANKSTVALGNGVLLDIATAAHVLIAGETGGGKSVLLHDVICSLLMKNDPTTMDLLLIDPKMVEFDYFYKNNPCLFCPVATDPVEALERLEQAANEMMRRYSIMKQEGKRFWTGKKLYIVIDEIADLISAGGKRLEKVIEKICRLGRGAGCHVIAATQHPVRSVISRQITANMDTRICLRVIDSSASRLVLGAAGGEKLKGKGDAIIRHNGEFRRFQAAYIDDESLERFAHSWTREEIAPQFKVTTDAKALLA